MRTMDTREGRPDLSPPSGGQTVFLHRTVLLVVLVSLLVGAMVAVVLILDHRQRREQAAVMAENLSWVLEQSLVGPIALLDQALIAVGDEAMREMAAGGIDPAVFNTFMARQNARLPNIDGMRATDAAGSTLYGEGVTPGANARGRDYFDRLLSDPDAGLAVSKPLVGRISGRWTIIFARRLNRPDGSFDGVVFSPVNIESFARILSMVNVGPGGTISLLGADRSVIARRPEPPGTGSGASPNEQWPVLHELTESGDGFKAYDTRSGIDKTLRLYSQRKIAGYPLSVAVGLSPEDFLASWRTNAATLVGLWFLFTLLLVFLAILVIHGGRHRLAAIRTLEENAALEAKVAERTHALEESNRKLAALSATDGLTGIANRRHFNEMLEKEWDHAGRTSQALALMLFDVDLFKNYNDHYGHPQGDDCLKQVAHLLNAHARRSGDLVARYGGEEFALLMPGMNMAKAQNVAERIRAALQDMGLPHDGSPLRVVTISIGVAAVVPILPAEPESLVKLADEALYQAKNRGRNQAVLASVPVA